MSTRGYAQWPYGTDRGKHEKTDNQREKDDNDPLGLVSLLFPQREQQQRTIRRLDDLANTSTGRFLFTSPSPIPLRRSQSVFSDTPASPYDLRKSNEEIKLALQSISTQIGETGDQILKDTRRITADVKHIFRQLRYDVTEKRKILSSVEMNVETTTRSEELQNVCKQEQKDLDASFEIGAVGGSLNGEKHCTEHGITDSVPEWKIDETTWGSCIKQKDRKEAQRLIAKRILPTQKMLNNASAEFGRDSQILKDMCNEISSCIKAESNTIVNVWAGYKTIYDKPTEENAIVFAVITKAKIQRINAFNYNVEQICIDEVNSSKENKDIQWHENENPLIDEEISKAVKRMKRHSQGLMKRHSNITRISVSWIKSSRYGREDAKMTNEACISLYVPRKGIIPINEKPFPKILDGFAVDVREGICVPFLGPHDVHESVKMGCAISGQSFAEQSNIGTIGGFIERENEIYCLTSAHVFAQNPNLKDLKINGTWTAALDDHSFNYVYQPSPPSEPFGTLVRAVFTEGGGGTAGVDAAVIHVRKRFPNSGLFPDAANDREAGFDKENPMTFHSGKISPSVKRMALVVKHGSTSGITKGSFRLRGGAIRTNTAHNWGFMLFNQYEIESFSDTLFAQAGDSGAMVFTIEGNELLGIGIVEAGMGNICLVTPIYDVLNALQIPRPFQMKQFMLGDTNTAIPVGCSVTTAAEDVIPQSDRTKDLNERFDYVDQALSQEVARQAKEIKEELHTKVDQQLLNLKTEINEKIESDITKLQTNIDRSMTSLEEKMNDMQNKTRDQMLQMKESVEEMLGKFLSQINQKK